MEGLESRRKCRTEAGKSRQQHILPPISLARYINGPDTMLLPGACVVRVACWCAAEQLGCDGPRRINPHLSVCAERNVKVESENVGQYAGAACVYDAVCTT